MQVKKGEVLIIDHRRKGQDIRVVALEDFDTATTAWYPVALADRVQVEGLGESWIAGDRLPCRASFVSYIGKEETNV